MPAGVLRAAAAAVERVDVATFGSARSDLGHAVLQRTIAGNEMSSAASVVIRDLADVLLREEALGHGRRTATPVATKVSSATTSTMPAVRAARQSSVRV